MHLTDFSPKRKDPLCREMRISSSFQQIQQLFDQLKTENITKGWNLYAQSQAAVKVEVSATPKATAAVAAKPDPVAPVAEFAPQKKAARKFAASETEVPAPAKVARKKKSG